MIDMIVIIVNVRNRGSRGSRRGEEVLKRLRRPAEQTECLAPMKFGAPQPCPQCGGPSFLGRIDLRQRVQHQHCLICKTHSAISELSFAKAS